MRAGAFLVAAALAAPGCFSGADHTGQELADAAADSSSQTTDSSNNASSDAAVSFSFTPWRHSIGAATSFYAATSLRTDAAGRVTLIGSAQGNLPFATTTDVTTFTSSSAPLIARYENDGTLEAATRVSAANVKPGVGAIDASSAVYLVTSAAPSVQGLGLTDVSVRKLDASGAPVWSKLIGSPQDDAGSAVAADANGNVIVVGTVMAAIAGQTAGAYADAFAAKYDTSGNLVWTRQFATATDEGASGVALDSAGNVYICGTGSTVTDPSAPHSDYYAFVRKLDASGAPLWSKQIGVGATPSAQAVAVDAAGDVLVAGGVNGALPTFTNAGSTDAAVWKLDGSGQTLWAKQLGTAGYDVATSVAVDAAGHVAVGGIVGGALPQKQYAGATDGFVRMYAADGTETWTEEFGSSINDEVAAVATDGGGNAYVAGTAYAGFSGVQELGFNDAFVLKFPAQ